MNDFARLVQEDMRLVILRILAEDADYSINEYILRQAMNYVGHNVSRDKLHTELAWLEEQGLLTVRDVMGVKVAKLTTRGLDTANGAAIMPGVKRPGPED
jgi:repressor of nif and glnA expression